MTQYTCHSGGCPGADMAWELTGESYGVHTIAYSFHNHVQDGKNQKILTQAELTEGFEHVKIAALSLKHNVKGLYPYVRNLLARNWYQVKNGGVIFAIGMFLNDSHTLVAGGTGWAVQMAVDNDCTIFFFDQPTKMWYKYSQWKCEFVPFDGIPILTKNFAGIGTRELDENGIKAVIEVFEATFSNEK